MAVPVQAAAPAAVHAVGRAVPEPQADFIVSLGDSFISGEGVMYANHNFEGGVDNFQKLGGTVTFTNGSRNVTGSGGFLGIGGSNFQNDAEVGLTLRKPDGTVLGVVASITSKTAMTLVDPATESYNKDVLGKNLASPGNISLGYPGTGAVSNWNAAPGDLSPSGKVPWELDNWNSVYGDDPVSDGEGGTVIFPDKGGKQKIPFCARSYVAPGNVGDGWEHLNLACSGAIKDSKVSELKNGQLGTKYTAFKPGIDFFDEPITPAAGTVQTVTAGKGQAKMLEEFAAGHDVKTVALSIGGNDFGFSDVIMACAMSFALSGIQKPCEESNADKVSEENLVTVTNAVDTSIRNIVTAMTNAGKAPGTWKLIYQEPPLPIGPAADTKYNGAPPSIERQDLGGCGFRDGTLNWINDTVYPRLMTAMRKGVVAAKDALGDTPVVVIDTGEAFKRHRLCGKDTIGQLNYAKGQFGKHPTWQDDNGKKTEWINYMSYTDQGFANVSMKSLPIHPNYWGQRALAACMSLALQQTGSLKMACTQDDANGLDEQGRPKMQVASTAPLWIDVVGKPTISGGNQVGQTLTADAEMAFSPAGSTLTYQWLRDDVAIDGATGQTYVNTDADLGSSISVTVTASRTGVTPASATSDAFGPVTDALAANVVTISGTPQVGKSLETPRLGVFTPEPDTIGIEWLANGTPIQGATDAFIDLTPDLIGAEIAVRYTGIRGATTVVTTTPAVGPVAKGTLIVGPGQPTVAGVARVGQVLLADSSPVAFTPSAQRVAYQWMRDADPIPGAVEERYEIAGEDLGHTIAVKVIGHADGYESATSAASDPTDTVVPGQVAVTGSVTLNPVTPEIGVPVTPVLDGAFEPFPNRPQFQWIVDGVPVDGANDFTYTPQSADKGKTIEVEVTADSIGYQAVTSKSAAATVVEGNFVIEGAPAITGTPKVGSLLTATKAALTVTPEPAATTIQWLRNGTPIAGATGETYRLVGADAAANISVKLTMSTPGYADATVTSPAVGPVAKGATAVTVAPKITGRVAVGSTLTATGPTTTPSGAKAYAWLRNGVAITGAKASTYKVSVADVGKKLSVRVTVTPATAYLPVTATSAATALVPKTPSKLTVTASGAKASAKVTVKLTVTGLASPNLKQVVTVKVGTTSKKLTLSTAGSGSVTFTRLTKGKKTVTVTFAGNTQILKSTASKTVTVK